MKKLLIVIALITMVLTTSGIAFADDSGRGPAPNSGDCISDGSGWDEPNGPIGDVGSGSGPVGPAPNSGDGIPDGPGWPEE